jgi:hypothetical protein
MESNNMKNKAKSIKMIILMGTLWGICEATIGYGLHFLPYGLSGMFMFPIGMYFMYNAYKKSDNKNAVLWVGMIAATIKFVDLLLPTRSLMSVINPAMSILLESLVVFAFVKVYKAKRTVVASYVIGLSWIVLFTLIQAFVFRPEIGLYNLPFAQFVLSILANALVSGTIVAIYLKNENVFEWKINPEKISWVIPVFTILLALSLEITNSLIF